LRGERGGCGEEDGRVGGGNSHLRRCRGLDGFEDDKDGLPEWCLEDEDEEMGTFDASGAFLPLKVLISGASGVVAAAPWLPSHCVHSALPTQKGPKEAIPEEQELDFRGLEEEEEEEEEPSEGVDEERPEAGEPS
jgi:PERQ amino acid-rich with GYF domain-containing protein